MKATGIVRRIDDLGRVVIPKEIRRTMRISEGAPLEIFVNADGGIVFRKYSPIGEMSESAKRIASCVHKGFGLSLAVCDRERIVAASGAAVEEIVDKPVSDQLSELMLGRKAFTTGGGDTVLAAEGGLRAAVAVQPVFGDGDLCGMVMILKGKDASPAVSENELQVLKLAAALLGSEMG